MTIERAVQEPGYSKPFKVHYAAILAEQSDGPIDTGREPVAVDPELVRPTLPPEVANRADFRVGHRVTFIDKNLQGRVGLIVRVNQHTVTLTAICFPDGSIRAQ